MLEDYKIGDRVIYHVSGDKYPGRITKIFMAKDWKGNVSERLQDNKLFVKVVFDTSVYEQESVTCIPSGYSLLSGAWRVEVVGRGLIKRSSIKYKFNENKT
jgi:hypothetical protein